MSDTNNNITAIIETMTPSACDALLTLADGGKVVMRGKWRDGLAARGLVESKADLTLTPTGIAVAEHLTSLLTAAA